MKARDLDNSKLSSSLNGNLLVVNTPDVFGNKKMSFEEVQAEMQRMQQQNPEVIAQVKQEIMTLMQTGEITADELNKMVQLARAALQDPNLYPQIRKYAIQQGMGTEADIPAEYDQGLLITIVIAGQAMAGGEGAQPGKVMPSMKEGGALPTKSGSPDGSIPINAHEGEYVIPAEVVRHYGTKFFEDLKTKMEKRNDVESGATNT
jgi:hypothetical protein